MGFCPKPETPSWANLNDTTQSPNTQDFLGEGHAYSIHKSLNYIEDFWKELYWGPTILYAFLKKFLKLAHNSSHKNGNIFNILNYNVIQVILIVIKSIRNWIFHILRENFNSNFLSLLMEWFNIFQIVKFNVLKWQIQLDTFQ